MIIYIKYAQNLRIISCTPCDICEQQKNNFRGIMLIKIIIQSSAECCMFKGSLKHQYYGFNSGLTREDHLILVN